jgi:uroporphyrinogen III methyltransferase/synthase
MGETGLVYIVGAGPGDPELLTLKGRRVLGLAGSVLYDHLANEALLELAPASAERLYVGKKRTERAFPQEEICAMMIDRARRGITVVRLKGGDPNIFGRGGEEAEALADAGIPFEVVPGVTSALGIAAYGGAPLTHRDYTAVVTFITGHNVARIEWDKVGASETLVIFMGIANLRAIAHEIVSHGRSPETPAMAVRWATRPDQQTVAGTLGNLPDLVEHAGMKPPATIVIGEVVRLREKLNWFERLPLFGTRIAITRAPSQSPELRSSLESLGAEVLDLPVISIQPPADPALLDAAVARLAEYDWIVFTSANGVRFFMDRLDRSPHDLRSLRARICAIGPATRRSIEDLHLKVDLMPGEYRRRGAGSRFRATRCSWPAHSAAPRGRGPRRDPRGVGSAWRSGGSRGGLSERSAARRPRAGSRGSLRFASAKLDHLHQFVDGNQLHRDRRAGRARRHSRRFHRAGDFRHAPLARHRTSC